MSSRVKRSLDIKTDVRVQGKRYEVSTVSMDRDFMMSEILGYAFETMVFEYDENGKVNFSDRYCERYATLSEAQSGHRFVVDELKAGNLELYE